MQQDPLVLAFHSPEHVKSKQPVLKTSAQTPLAPYPTHLLSLPQTLNQAQMGYHHVHHHNFMCNSFLMV